MARTIWAPYVSVAERRLEAVRLAKQEAQAGRAMSPVVIEQRTIATTFWGQAWCQNVEHYSDYDNRLPRGKRYVRNGSVIDLKVERGAILALVSGSSVYRVRLDVASLAPNRWKQLCQQCSGSVASAVELLQGRVDRAVMSAMSSRQSGLFPASNELKMTCSCPDSARLCKHVAAVLYGVGARLDDHPELLFALRGVDFNELVSAAASGEALIQGKRSGRRKLDSGAIAAVFDIELGVAPAPASAATVTKSSSAKTSKKPVVTPLPAIKGRVKAETSSGKPRKKAAKTVRGKAAVVKAQKSAKRPRSRAAAKKR
jgi:uncharacterized Zn finger protein